MRSMYAALINNGVRVSQDIWQVKIPSKIRIFLWYLKRGVILTKDNLARRNRMVTKVVLFAIVHKRSNISFSTVHTLNSYGALFISCLDYHPH